MAAPSSEDVICMIPPANVIFVERLKSPPAGSAYAAENGLLEGME